MTLAAKIEERIKTIPCHNSGFITFHQETLRTVLQRELIHQIAEAAAEEADKWYGGKFDLDA